MQQIREKLLTNIPVRIILLEHDIDRRKNTEELCKIFPQAMIQPAVNKMHINFITLSETQKKQIKPELKNILIVNGMRVYSHTPKNKNLSLTYSEASCAISHRLIWEEIARTDLEYCLILEDNACLQNKEVLNEVIRNIPDSFDIINLFTTLNLDLDNIPTGFFLTGGHFNTTTSYIISNQGAKKFLNMFSDNGIPSIYLNLEESISVQSRTGIITSFMYNPFPFCTADGIISIGNKERDKEYKDEWDNYTWNKPYTCPILVEIGDTDLAGQMFQYAAAKSLSIKTERPVLIIKKNNFSLDLFPYFRNEQIVDQFDFPFKIWTEKEMLDSKIDGKIDNGSPVLIKGNLQNIEYIRGQEDIIRFVFTWTESILKRCKEILKFPRKDTSVIVSIYIKENDSIDYIQSAIDNYQNMFEEVHFLITSGDIRKVQEKYKLNTKQSIRWVEVGLIENLCLMSLVDHYILTGPYSWWGWFLNRKQNKSTIFQPLDDSFQPLAEYTAPVAPKDMFTGN